MHFLDFLIFVIFCWGVAECHVSWQYPVARYPPLDGLDSQTTKQPCGIPRPPNGNFSNFETGIPYNFTWRMDNNHQGGLRISLYNSSGIIVKRLVPPASESQGFFHVGKDQLPIQQVTFDSICSKCILRLEKQAVGNSFVYHSCADISVSQIKEEEQQQQGKKAVCVEIQDKNGPFLKCHCDPGWDGEDCQYKVDCVEDSDCGGQDGLCVAQPNSTPLKICYCPNGRFGRYCEKESVIAANECFNVNNDDSTNFSSYGIFNENCYKKADLNGKDFVYSRLVENGQLEVILDFSTNGFAAIGWRPINTNSTCRHFPQLGRQKNGTNGFLDKKFSSSLSPMDCTDIIWGAVHQGRVVIRDAYSRDMSTPLDDHWFGGEDNIAAVYGWQLEDFEAGLRTIVLFRRNVKADEPTDHSFGPGPMFGIYAKGTSTKSEGESIFKVENEERVFFQRDELDHESEDRGPVELNFVSKEEFEMISDRSPKICCYSFGFILGFTCLHVFLSKMASLKI